MNFKSIVSALLITSTLAITIPVKRANAGIVVTAGSLAVAMSVHNNYATGITALLFGVPTGAVVTIAGVITAFANPALGIGLIVLSEDGTLPQNDLETVLAQKYSFIQDNKVIADLAKLIKIKAASEVAIDGKKMISLSEAEVKSVLESTDLLETHAAETQTMIRDFK